MAYDGTLVPAKMDPVARRAYKAFRNQIGRCKNKNNPRFKTYGARGVRVVYGVREFIEWYMTEFFKKESLEFPSVGRIDHAGNYEFGNVELIERSENSKERIERVGFLCPNKPFAAVNEVTGESFTFISTRQAAEQTGIARATIMRQLHKTTKSNVCWRFDYLEKKVS